MSNALETTFEVLSTTRNEAAVPVLIAALDSSEESVSDGTLKALVARRSKQGHLAVLARWHLLELRQQELVQEGRGRMSGDLRDAALSEDPQLFANACKMVEQFSEFDLVPTLVTLAENQKSPHAKEATELVLRQVDRLSAMVHGPRDYKDRRDPQAIRRFILESLERSVERFRHHKRSELIEAFVILGGPTCSVLKSIIDDPHHPCYLTVVHILTSNASPGVVNLLLSFLNSDAAPLNILNVISHRCDETFVSRLLASTDEELTPPAVKNLGRIKSFACLSADGGGVSEFDEQDQARCIKLMAVTGVSSDDLLDLLEEILERGEQAGRLSACEALISIPGDRANRLVLNAVKDLDPQVQAAATCQLRDRHIPGTMALLLKLIDSPHEKVREAAKVALSDFSFENFLTKFETLNDEARHSTATLVKKIDSESVPRLLNEMEAKILKRRLRAIEMAEVMGLIVQVSKGLIERLEDDEHLVRVAAAEALRLCYTPEVQEALQLAANDRSVAVKNAATSSLEIFAGLPGLTSPGVMSTTE